MAEIPCIDYIALRRDTFGWALWVYTGIGNVPQVFEIGDAIQFQQETERTIGRWLADGPADFHNTPDHEPTDEEHQTEIDYDLMRDTKRGK